MENVNKVFVVSVSGALPPLRTFKHVAVCADLVTAKKAMLGEMRRTNDSEYLLGGMFHKKIFRGKYLKKYGEKDDWEMWQRPLSYHLEYNYTNRGIDPKKLRMEDMCWITFSISEEKPHEVQDLGDYKDIEIEPWPFPKPEPKPEPYSAYKDDSGLPF